jgi:origin recognition complex subunit 1
MAKEKIKKVVKKDVKTLETLRKMLWTDNTPAELPHRQEELEKIDEFCRFFIEKRDDSCSLYLGGVPGTGKTSCVLKTIKTLKEDKKIGAKFKFIHLNGGEMVRPEDLYAQFYNELEGKSQWITAGAARQKLSTIFKCADAKRLPVIVLLDELDFLVNKNQSVIYDVFEFASVRESRLAIISITNTFDFTSRVLDSRIQSRIGTNRVHFQPYSWEQIMEILINRLRGCENLVDKSAIQLASRKVANMSGDIRKALDVLRRAIDIAITNGCEKLSMKDIDAAGKETKNTYRMCLVRSMSKHELVFFRALYNDFNRNGLQDTPFGYVYRHYEQLCCEHELDALDIDEVLQFVQDGVGTGFYNLSKAPGSFTRKISLGFAMYEAKFCLDTVAEEEN